MRLYIPLLLSLTLLAGCRQPHDSQSHDSSAGGSEDYLILFEPFVDDDGKTLDLGHTKEELKDMESRTLLDSIPSFAETGETRSFTFDAGRENNLRLGLPSKKSGRRYELSVHCRDSRWTGAGSPAGIAKDGNNGDLVWAPTLSIIYDKTMSGDLTLIYRWQPNHPAGAPRLPSSGTPVIDKHGPKDGELQLIVYPYNARKRSVTDYKRIRSAGLESYPPAPGGLKTVEIPQRSNDHRISNYIPCTSFSLRSGPLGDRPEWDKPWAESPHTRNLAPRYLPQVEYSFAARNLFDNGAIRTGEILKIRPNYCDPLPVSGRSIQLRGEPHLMHPRNENDEEISAASAKGAYIDLCWTNSGDEDIYDYVIEWKEYLPSGRLQGAGRMVIRRPYRIDTETGGIIYDRDSKDNITVDRTGKRMKFAPVLVF